MSTFSISPVSRLGAQVATAIEPGRNGFEEILRSASETDLVVQVAEACRTNRLFFVCQLRGVSDLLRRVLNTSLNRIQVFTLCIFFLVHH